MILTIKLSDTHVKALQAKATAEGLSVEQWIEKMAGQSALPPEKRTGADLIAALQASPYRDIEIEPERYRLPRARRYHLMTWLLDTNILSEVRRLKPETKVLAFIADRPLDEFFISTVTLAELRFGIANLNTGERREELSRWLAHTVRPMFDQRVLPVTEDILFRWRVLMEEGRKIGHTYSQPDLIIAATAIHHSLAVVTRDESDFVKAGVTVINPWKGVHF